jgi:hypothetical protein
MKTEEITLFSANEPLDDETRTRLELIKSTIMNDVQIIVDEDNFLREKLDQLRVEWNFNTRSTDPLYAHVHRQDGKLSNDLVINIPALEKLDNRRQELLFQLYKLPGERRVAEKLPVVQRKLKKWVDKLGDYFFVLYPAYHSQLTAAGAQLGLMKNHPEYREKILDSYLQILETGLPVEVAKHDLGDMDVEKMERGMPVKTSLFSLGLLKLLADHSKDYLLHYVAGTPVYTMSSVFSSVDERIGNEMKRRISDIYELSDKKVVEKLSENAKSVGQKAFDEFYYPSLDEDGYQRIVDEFLKGCGEMQQMMKERYVQKSLIKPSNVGAKHIIQGFDFLSNTRDHSYVQ